MNAHELGKVHELQRRVVEIAQALIDRKAREQSEQATLSTTLIHMQKLIDDLKRGSGGRVDGV